MKEPNYRSKLVLCFLYIFYGNGCPGLGWVNLSSFREQICFIITVKDVLQCPLNMVNLLMVSHFLK